MKDLWLSLSPGGARALAHIGVLQVLEEAGIRPRLIAGASMGAVVGACVGAGIPMADVAERMARLRLFHLLRPVPTRLSLLSHAPMKRLLKELFGDARIEDLDPPLEIHCTDVHRATGCVLRRGPLVPALLATMTILGALPPVRWGDRLLADGAYVAPIPTPRVPPGSVLLVCDANAQPQTEGWRAARGTWPGVRWLCNIQSLALHGTDMLFASIIRTRPPTSDEIVIRPELSRASFLEFRKASVIIEQGRLAALEKIDELRRGLGVSHDLTCVSER